MHGEAGTMSFGDGGLYAGAWDNDARHGKGAMRYANGEPQP